MLENKAQWNNCYNEQGYFVLRDYFTKAEIVSLRNVISIFHTAWKNDNIEFYQDDAFNSSLITGSKYLPLEKRVELFNFISSTKIMNIVNSLIPVKAAFMNTQLFFNPFNQQQKNFWHRDCQYDHDVEAQEKAIKETQVLHLRVPLFDELGIELIPGTHKRWDNQEELDVRLENNKRVSSEDLPNGKQIELAVGDILIFSADMIHRGVYGLERLALDILIFDPSGNFVDYVDDDCLPDESILSQITNPDIFKSTLHLKAKSIN